MTYAKKYDENMTYATIIQLVKEISSQIKMALNDVEQQSDEFSIQFNFKPILWSIITIFKKSVEKL